MVFSQLCNGSLLFRVVRSLQDSVHPPFIAEGRAEHASHQVIVAIRMRKRMQRIVFVHAKFFRRDEDGSAGPQGNVAHAISHRAGSDCGCRIIPGTGRNFCRIWNSQLIRNLRKHGSHTLVRFIDLRQLLRADAARAGVTDIDQRNGCLLLTIPQFDLRQVSLLCGDRKYKGRLLFSAGELPYLSLRLKQGEDALRAARTLVADYAAGLEETRS